MELVEAMEEVLFEIGEQVLPPLVLARLLLAEGVWGGETAKEPTRRQIRQVTNVARRRHDKFKVEVRAGRLNIELTFV